MIGEKLKKARKTKKLTQQEVAIKTNIQRTTLSKIENNVYEPSISQLQKLIKIYNLDADWLLFNKK